MKQLLQRNNIPPANIDDPRYPRSELFSNFRDFYLFESIGFLAVVISISILVLYANVLTLNVNDIIKISLTIALTLVVSSFIIWTSKDRKQENMVLELRRERRMTQREEQRQLELESQPPGFKLIHILRGHSSNITNIVWSSNGLNLVSGSYDNTVRLWNSQDGQVLHIFRTSVGNNITLSPDGLFLATDRHFVNNTINIWNAQSAKLVTSISEKNSKIICIKWSPKAAIVASVSAAKKRTIRLWSIETEELLYTLIENEYYTNYIAWSPDGFTLASLTEIEAHRSNAIHLWNAHTGNLRSTLIEEPNYATYIVWSPDGCMIASNSEDNSIRIWHLPSARCIKNT